MKDGTVIGTLKFDAEGSGHRYWLEVDGVAVWLWAAVSDAPSPSEVTLTFKDGRIVEAK